MSFQKKRSYNKEGKKRDRYGDAKPSKRRVAGRSKDGHDGEREKRGRYGDAKPSRRRSAVRSKDGHDGEREKRGRYGDVKSSRRRVEGESKDGHDGERFYEIFVKNGAKPSKRRSGGRSKEGNDSERKKRGRYGDRKPSVPFTANESKENHEGERKRRDRYGDAKPNKRRGAGRSKEGHEGERKRRDRYRDSKPSKRRVAGKSSRKDYRSERKPRFREQQEPLEAIKMEGLFGELIPQIQHALRKEGYAVPTPVQAQAIPPQVEGKDLFGSAQTGTGKTAAFTIPILQELAGNMKLPESGQPRALILAPTRELAAQIGKSIETYGHFSNVSSSVIFGGVSQKPQEKSLDQGVDIVVATPGRLLDLMGQGCVELSQVETFILDEADRMLDMGFIPDIEKVIAQLPKDRRNSFFSATVPKAVEDLAGKILVDPVRVTIDPEKPTVEKIEQRVLYVDRSKKDELLIDLIRKRKIKRAIVFAKMKYRASRICEQLDRAGISSAPIHGDKSQAARTRALGEFRSGNIKVLVATDIAARGIDVDNITDVFNYDLPVEAETYVHRIGRTARAGAEGHAWTFCSKDEVEFLHEVEKFIKKKITDEIDHEFHRESILNAVRTFKTSRRKQAQKKDKKKKPKQWALKRKPRSIKDLSN